MSALDAFVLLDGKQVVFAAETQPYQDIPKIRETPTFSNTPQETITSGALDG